MTDDLDDLQRTWAAYGRQLETQTRLSRALLNASTLQRARPALRGLGLAILFELLATCVALVALGSFIYDHSSAPRYWLPAAVLDLYAVAYLQGLVRQALALRAVDLTLPVAAVQRRLAELRRLRLRVTQLVFVSAALVWTPLLIVALQAFFGLDAYRLFGGVYLAVSVLFGVVAIGLALWLARTFGERLMRLGFMRGLVESLEGRALVRASAFLATLDDFESNAA